MVKKKNQFRGDLGSENLADQGFTRTEIRQIQRTAARQVGRGSPRRR